MIFALVALAVSTASSKSIYREYQKLNDGKSFVHMVEIFDAHREPPTHSRNEKELNDFLGLDLLDSKATTAKLIDTKKRSPERAVPPTSDKLPNPRRSKPLIKPNPKENVNPDYSDLLMESST